MSLEEMDNRIAELKNHKDNSFKFLTILSVLLGVNISVATPVAIYTLSTDNTISLMLCSILLINFGLVAFEGLGVLKQDYEINYLKLEKRDLINNNVEEHKKELELQKEIVKEEVLEEIKSDNVEQEEVKEEKIEEVKPINIEEIKVENNVEEVKIAEAESLTEEENMNLLFENAMKELDDLKVSLLSNPKKEKVKVLR